MVASGGKCSTRCPPVSGPTDIRNRPNDDDGGDGDDGDDGDAAAMIPHPISAVSGRHTVSAMHRLYQ